MTKQYPETLTQQIDEALNILDLALRLQIGFREKHINDICFNSSIGINYNTGSFLKPNLGFDSNSLFKNRFRNLVFSAMNTASCAINRALEDKFGNKNPDDHSNVGSIRIIFWMLRCAFSHNPNQPQWECRKQYCKSPYVIEINKKQTSHVTFQDDYPKKIKFSFDFQKLNVYNIFSAQNWAPLANVQDFSQRVQKSSRTNFFFEGFPYYIINSNSYMLDSMNSYYPISVHLTLGKKWEYPASKLIQKNNFNLL